MGRLVISCLMLATLLYAAGEKRKPPKPPDLEVIELTARRTEGRILVDFRIRNSGLKTLENVVVLLDFLAPENKVVTTQRAEIEPAILDPGEEAEFHGQLRDPARAVRCRINSQDGAGRELTVSGSGPFVID